MAGIIRANKHLHFGARPGALGDALHSAGLRTAVAGNADGGAAGMAQEVVRRRYAGLALADHLGRVDAGEVGDELTVRDPDTVNGFETNAGALETAARRALAVCEVCFIELADTEREGLVLYSGIRDGAPPPGDGHPARVAALGRDDALLARIAGGVDLSRDVLLVLGTSGPGPALQERLTVAVMAGPGIRAGWLTSPTTRRLGLVTLSDVAPGILKMLEIPAPASMTGTPLLTAAGDRSFEERIETLGHIEARAMFHDRWVGAFFAIFVALQVALYLICWRLVATGAAKGLRAARAATCVLLAAPLATFLIPITGADLHAHAAVPLIFLATVSTVAAIALRGPSKPGAAGPGSFICGLTAAVIAADLVGGGPLQMSTLFGYSPVVAGRFFGIGNLSFAVFATCSILAAAHLAGRAGRKGIWIAGAIGLAAIILDGAPWLGADLGGILSLVPGFGVLLLLLAGKKISPLRVTALIVAAAAAAFLVGFIDSLRPAASQTHIGRFTTRLLHGGLPAISDVIARKLQANLWLLTRSILILLIPIALAFIVFVLMRPTSRLREAFRTQPGLRAGLVAVATTSLIGFATNDSGMAIPAMSLGVAIPYVLSVILAAWSSSPPSSPPSP
jgi:hypothetical protein